MENGQAVGSASSSNEDVQHSRAQEYKHSGNDKFNNSNYKGAIIDYKKGLLHEPNNPDLHANLSAAYIHLEKYLDAEEHAVYTINLRPDFYKGYMRAAKAAHGKGLTTLALKRLSEGLSHVTDPNGVRELNRLKNQYTSYLSLKSNAEREIDCSSEKYMSEDEDEPYSEDEEDFKQEFENQVSSHCSEQENCESKNSMNTFKKDSEETKFDKSVDVTDEPKKLFPEITDSQKAKALPLQATVERSNLGESETSSKEKRRKIVPYALCGLGLTKEEQKSYLDRVAERPTTPQSHAENDESFNNKSNSKEKQPDRTSEICKQNSKDSELNKHVEEFKELLKIGSEAFLSGHFRKAVESYKAAKERVGVKVTDYDIDDRQYHVIKYVYCAALINLGSYEDVVKAIQNLLEMETYKLSIPALYIQLARAYCKLNRFKTAIEPLEKLQDILENCPIFPTFSWPGTSETIQETTPTGLKDAVKELGQTCRMPHKPTAICRYDNCLKTTTHILPSELIHLSDPDFSGFVRMVCEEKCHIEFHIACWKAYKESISGISKINDKDFLGQRCLTTDCVNSDGKHSLIIVTEIIDADGQVKSVNKLDPKTMADSKCGKEIQGDKKSKKKKCKLDDKEKVVKPKKPKQKKVQEVKKPTLIVEEDDELVESSRNTTDSMNILESRIQSLKELRRINFGMEKSWDPKIPFYGRSDEMEKWMDKCEEETSNVQYLDYNNDESIDVKDAKEFIFSYFMEILKVEKALKLSDVEELWKQVADDFCNIKVVLPNLKNMCELLLESTCFCQLEDYICLAGHLDMAFATVKTEVVETVQFLMTGSTEQTSSRASQAQLPDLLNHQQATTSSSHIKSLLSSEDESTESQDEYISGPDSEESEEESSDEEEEHFETPPPPVLVTQNNEQVEEFTIPTIKPLDDEKFSLQNMLDEMSRVKNMFMKTTLDESQDIDKIDQMNQEVIGSPQNDTFETAHESSHDFSDDDKNISNHSNDEDETQTVHADCGTEQNVCTETIVSQVLDQVESSDTVIENEQNNVNVLNGTENAVPADDQAPTTDAECDKASQAEVFTEERHIQTAVETRDNLSQTKDSDLYKELNQKVQELTKQVNDLNKENTNLAKEVIDKENLNKEIKKAHEKTIASLQDKHNKAIATLKERNKTLREDFSKQEAEFKQAQVEISSELETMLKNCKTLMLEKLSSNKQLNSLLEEKRELEMSRVATEQNLKAKLYQSQQAQLIITKAFWENQVNLLVKRCVEKISEMHSWFSLLPSGEVEELPSWKDVRQITMQWGEIRNKLQQIQAEFQMKCSVFESKLSRGEEVGDVCSLTLPSLPDEPNPLPLDKIHKEITEKYTKRIGELTELVASQQLEIKKSEDNIQQFQNLIGSFPLAPRAQNPMTTAFGGLALQYSYPPSLPTMFGSAAIPTIPPNQDISKIGGHTSKPMQADVQTLLQESSSAKFNAAAEKSSVTGIGGGNMLPLSTNSAMPSSFLSMPPPNMTLPPPPIGVAQSLLKSTSALVEKKDQKPVEQQAHPKPEAAKSGSSRESTPGLGATPVPTPEKTRKKKKSKADIRDIGDVKAPTPVPAAAFASEDVDSTPWSVCVSKKNLPKPMPVAAAPASDSKLKNKKRLLDKLQLKFPTTPLKDLDEIVKLVREQNNGFLSGLPFDEIETRVDRIITKKHYQKSSTMGLVKFSNAAWGPVKQQETVTWTNLQLEECTICLEPMGKERTKVDCNHEFHTKCLRKWLKEKSVCPLCNKFTTMPDEFPAL